MGIDKANPQGVAVVSRSRVAALGKGTTIPDALRLAAKHHGNAEPAISSGRNTRFDGERFTTAEDV